MRLITSAVIVLLTIALGSSVSRAQSRVELSEVPKLECEPVVASDAEVIEIKQLIAELAMIDESSDGLGRADDDSAFVPLGSMTSAVSDDPNWNRTRAFVRLVELGPKSLPFLLQSLDDLTPTKFKVTCDRSGGGEMWYERSLPTNKANQREEKVVSALQPEYMPRVIDSYTLKVGDVCFVAIGQIVGRQYKIVIPQPYSSVGINSPTVDSELRQVVLELWMSDEASKILFESLLIDYSTRGIYNGKLTDGWGMADRLQRSAATRLLYYFPDETASTIADRLDGLQVDAPDNIKGSMQQCIANQICATGLVEAVAWSNHPRIKQSVLQIFERTSDPDVLVAAIGSVGPDHPDLLRRRIAEMIQKIPDSKTGGPFGLEYRMLIGLGDCGGDEAKAIFDEFLKIDSIQRRRSVIHALRKTRSQWATQIIGRFLDDHRAVEWISPDGGQEPLHSVRVCDEAAETLALANHSLFRMSDTHQERDLQIERMKIELGLH